MATAPKAAFKYKIVNDLKLDVLKLEDKTEYFVRIESAIRLGAPKANSATEKSADVVNVTNLADGKKYVVLLNAVVKSSITEAFPLDAYVGKSFRIFGTGKVAGKRYKGYEVSEIEAE